MSKISKVLVIGSGLIIVGLSEFGLKELRL